MAIHERRSETRGLWHAAIGDPWSATREDVLICELWLAAGEIRREAVRVAIRIWFEVYFQGVTGNFE